MEFTSNAEFPFGECFRRAFLVLQSNHCENPWFCAKSLSARPWEKNATLILKSALLKNDLFPRDVKKALFLRTT